MGELGILLSRFTDLYKCYKESRQKYEQKKKEKSLVYSNCMEEFCTYQTIDDNDNEKNAPKIGRQASFDLFTNSQTRKMDMNKNVAQ